MAHVPESLRDTDGRDTTCSALQELRRAQHLHFQAASTFTQKCELVVHTSSGWLKQKWHVRKGKAAGRTLLPGKIQESPWI